MQQTKNNKQKELMCYCYTMLVEKLGPKIKTFQSVEKLVQVAVVMLSEGAAEVRN